MMMTSRQLKLLSSSSARGSLLLCSPRALPSRQWRKAGVQPHATSAGGEEGPQVSVPGYGVRYTVLEEGQGSALVVKVCGWAGAGWLAGTLAS